MSKSILEIDTPESCKECDLWRYCLHDRKLTLFADARNPACPLKTVSENKEFTIAVIGRTGSEYRTYNVRAQNKKRAKEKALELFRDECGENFDNVSVLSTWEHKEAKDG